MRLEGVIGCETKVRCPTRGASEVVRDILGCCAGFVEFMAA